jgi:hypothetical protein
VETGLALLQGGRAVATGYVLLMVLLVILAILLALIAVLLVVLIIRVGRGRTESLPPSGIGEASPSPSVREVPTREAPPKPEDEPPREGPTVR